MVIKNLENKIKLVLIICSLFLLGCIIISISSIWTAKVMVSDAHQKVYVLDGNVPILVQRSTMEETLDVEAKSHVEMFHHYFFTLAPDDKYIKYTMDKAMYLVDETGLAQYNTLKEKGFYSNIMGTSAVFSIFATASTSIKRRWSSPTMAANVSRDEQASLPESLSRQDSSNVFPGRTTTLMACSSPTGERFSIRI